MPTREEIIEASAEAAHESWLAEKLGRLQELHPHKAEQSWPSETGEEQLVHWDVLSESVRDFDRIVVGAIYDTLVERGLVDESMTLAQAQAALVPHKRPLDSQPLMFWALGLGEECGEVQGVVKKATHREVYEKGSGSTVAEYDERMLDEAGNVLFYLRNVLAKRGYTLEDAVRRQIELMEPMKPGDR